MKAKKECRLIAIDQYGQFYPNLKHPRADLMNRIGRKHVDRIYVDKKDGSSVNVGYIIGGLWLTLYRIERFEKPA